MTLTRDTKGTVLILYLALRRLLLTVRHAIYSDGGPKAMIRAFVSRGGSW